MGATLSNSLISSPILHPVGVVHAARREPSRDTVIIPIDPSKQAEAAFEWYYRHVHKTSNYVRVVHCQEIEHPSGEDYPDYAVPPEAFIEKLEDAKKSGMDLVNMYEKKLNDYKVSGSVEAHVGRPGEVIVNAADKHHASMIVMGSRGYGIVRRTILGSVSEYVIHHSKVPVTVVPRETTSWFF